MGVPSHTDIQAAPVLHSYAPLKLLVCRYTGMMMMMMMMILLLGPVTASDYAVCTNALAAYLSET